MALYHKHRPQSFSRIIGQDAIVQTITNQIITHTTAHAYLFSGPRGVGKTTTARLLAKAINCPRIAPDSAEPDNDSPEAKEITQGRSIDVIEIDAASHTGVDNVRENIIENAQFKPTTLAYKVFIIDEVHMLSTSAFNALLKTLEEPPSHIVFILATTELHKIPDTIISRCQRFSFSHISQDAMKKYLQSVAKEESITVDDTVLDHIITKSDGCVRDAINALEQAMATGEKHITSESASFLLPESTSSQSAEFISAISENNTQSALTILQNIYSSGINLIHFADEIIGQLRSVLISHLGKTGNTPMSTKNSMEIIAIIDIFIKRKNQIKASPLPQLPLEIAVFEICANGTQTTKENTSFTPTQTKKEVQKIETPKPVQKNTPEEKKEPEEINKNSTTKAAAGKEITHSEVEASWQSFIENIDSLSPSLISLLRTAELVKTEGNTITISVEFSFHKDKLLETKTAQKIHAALLTTFSVPLILDILVNEKDSPNTSSSEIDELAETFGGEVV